MTALAASCSRGTEQPPTPPPVEAGKTLQRSREAIAAFEAWLDRYDDARSVAASRKITTPLEELDARVGIDQTGRLALSVLEELQLSDADFAEANKMAWEVLSANDAANTEFLKSILPAEGWFAISQYGESAGQNAFLITQHSPDNDFRASVLARMEPLLASGEVKREYYALMFDRVAIQEGRPQRYGTQGECRDGVILISPVEDDKGLEARRAEMGLAPMEDYGRMLGLGKRC